MTKFFTNAFTKGNNIVHYYVENGERKEEKVAFEPTAGIEVKENSKHKDIFGRNISLKHFDSIREYYSWKKEKATEDTTIFGDISPNYQFLSEHYKDEIVADFEHIKIFVIDIEVFSEEGFPHASEALHPVTAITIQDYFTKEINVFGCQDYEVKQPNVTYHKCEDEKLLLERFIRYWHNQRPDIVTGWYTEGFDIPYLINRCRNLDMATYAKKLSPVGMINEYELNAESKEIGYKLRGVSQLDYKEVFEKFNLEKMENYQLDTVARHELGDAKLDYHDGYKSLADLYKNNYDLYIDYNIKDVELVTALNEKKKFFEVIFFISYKSRCTYEDTLGTVKPWDAFFFNVFKKDNLVVAPNKKHIKIPYPGGFCKQPIPGFYKNLIVYDITSSYPNQIISGNISPECIVPPEALPDELKELSKKLKKVTWMKDAPESFLDIADMKKYTPLLKEYGVCVNANGCFFRTGKEGLFSGVVAGVFQERVTYKKESVALKNKLKTMDPNDEGYEELEKLFTAKDSMQYALKIFMNSLYGAFSNAYFRYFSVDLSSAVTIMGQLCVKGPEHAVEKRFEGVKNRYIDTDSIFLDLDSVVNKRFPDGYTGEGSRDFIKDFAKQGITPVIETFYKELTETFNMRKNTYVMDYEVISDKTILVSKKKYVMNKVHEDGLDFDLSKMTPKKITGLDIIRSNTPMVVRHFLRGLLDDMLLSMDNGICIDKIAEFKAKFYKMTIGQVARPTGVNGLTKWAPTDKHVDVYGNKITVEVKKRTPINVRAARTYNKALKKYNLIEEPPIKEGEKIRYCYIKLPNAFRSNVMAFQGEPPKTILNKLRVDYDTQFQKTVLAPIEGLFDIFKWKTKRTTNLEEWF